MLLCFLLGLGVLVVVFLVPQGAKLFRTARTCLIYKYCLLTAYVGSLLWLTIVKRWGLEVTGVRFQPFYVLRRLLDCWFHFREISASTCKAILRNNPRLFHTGRTTPIEDLLLNIFIFIPMGFLLPYIWPKLRFWKTIFISLLFSACVEGMQYVAQVGCCDIDDVINNTLGACIGYGCFFIYTKRASH